MVITLVPILHMSGRVGTQLHNNVYQTDNDGRAGARIHLLHTVVLDDICICKAEILSTKKAAPLKAVGFFSFM